MKPFYILIIVFIFSNLTIWFSKGHGDHVLAGKIALSVMLLFTALGHFIYTTGMELMLPDFVPFKRTVVYVTGVFEALAAVGILVSTCSRETGIMLILFFIAVLPANIRACFSHLNYETASFDGAGPAYLWFRIPFQLLLICWTYYVAIR